MSWFKRNKRPELDIITNDIPTSTVHRWYLYDTKMLEDINDIAEAIGLTRVSSEGDAKEKEDSEERLLNLTGIFPFLYNMSELSADVMTAIHAKELVETDESAEEAIEVLTNMHNIYKATALSTLIGTFSTALALGIIETNTISSTTYFLEEDDEDE